ncbi:PilZ domain-containing protein [Oceanispirochaeta sp.]|jgi:c-di-GMP-binding flagellar brake protein YcgR|uniref:PilZ domain-containing protein n=1 Tax=Oceanispirochaeta sp. TaxID=2035350 RepID=UPI0026142B5C|nr:PilZ domain-containing protein [Oceanispirochaeta sp.]MDA3956423.1 PilZ domain-containing protein [Oceanispirochaeta sp.]
MSILYTLLTLFIIASSVPLFLGVRKGLSKVNWVEFYSMGKDAGFSFKEINLLRKVAVVNRHQKPSALFWSVDVLDKSLAGIHKLVDKENDNEEREYLEYLLKKLYSYRKSVEFKKPRYNRGLETTFDIAINQIVKLKVDVLGIYESSVLENNRNYILVTYPKGPPLPVGFSWRDRTLNVYFWRREDAGYFFQSRIMEGYPDRDFKTLRMSHSEVVLRSQKRKSVRTSCKLSAQLYPVKSLKTSNQLPESQPGLRCILQDISEDGAAIMIGGQGKINMCCKLQMELFGKVAVMRGVVRTIDYDRDKNLSVLHIQAEDPDEQSRYLILAFVYDIYRNEQMDDSTVNQNPETFDPGPLNDVPLEESSSVEGSNQDEDLESLETVDEELPSFDFD